METNSIPKNKPSGGNFSEMNAESTDRWSYSFTSDPQNTPQMVDPLFSSPDYYTDEKITCVTAEAKPSLDLPFSMVRWRSEPISVSTAQFASPQVLPLDARIVSRDLALAENTQGKSVAVCRRNGSSVTSQVISTILKKAKWAWHASAKGDTLCAVNDVNEFNNWFESLENSERQSAAARSNIEIWDIPGKRRVTIEPSTIDFNDSDGLFESCRMSISHDGNMLLGAITWETEDGLLEEEHGLEVWRKQEVQEGNNFVFQSDTRFNHGSDFEKMKCGDQSPHKCRADISILACSDDKNKVAIGLKCAASMNLAVHIVASPTSRHNGLTTAELQSQGTFEHMLFSPSGTWLAFFCKSLFFREESKIPAKLFRLDGAAVELSYDILGEGEYDSPCFSSDSSLFAYTTLGHTKVIDLANLSQVDSDLQSKTIGLNHERVTSLDFSPLRKKNTLIVVSEGKIDFWEFKPLPTWVGVLNLAPHALFQQAVFSSNGSSIMALDKAGVNIYLLTLRDVKEADSPSDDSEMPVDIVP